MKEYLIDESFKENEGHLSPKQTKSIEEIFKANPEYASLWTSKEQFQEYLNSIFPDTKVKEIVWHGTKQEFEFFDKSKLGTNASLSELSRKGFFFSDNLRVAKYYGDIKPYLLDIKNPAISDDQNNGNVIGAALGDIENAIQKTLNSDGVIAKNYKDTVVEDDETKSTGNFLVKQNQFVVFEPEQIHILCSDQDIKKAKEWLEINK